MAVARFDSLISLAAGSITASYTTLGSPLTQNWRIFKITNDTDGNMLISFNGTTDNIFVPAASFTLYDLSTNAPPIAVTSNLVLALGTQFYIKYVSAPTTGSVYVEGVYAKGAG
jgi:hypothetical protein